MRREATLWLKRKVWKEMGEIFQFVLVLMVKVRRYLIISMDTDMVKFGCLLGFNLSYHAYSWWNIQPLVIIINPFNLRMANYP
jgi:hypothetical protein